jgi:ABC-2 type transport system permease protein
MRDGFRLYRRLVAASWRAVLQYKFSFLVSVFFNCWVTVTDFLVVLTILYNTKTIGGWNLPQIGVIYGVVGISSALFRVFGCELHVFQNYIIQGEYDGILLRPWPSLLVLLSRRVEFFRLGGVIQGGTALLLSLHYLGGPQTLGWTYFYLLLLPLSGTLIIFGISIAIAACAFWFGRVRDLQTLTFYGANYAASYPTSIYPGWMRALLTLVPVTFIGYFPAKYALGLGGAAWYLLLPWLAAGITLVLANWIWRAGEAAYQSSGS